MSINVRSANLDDSGFVLACRNYEVSREFSTNDSIITVEEHEKWYQARMKKTDGQNFWIFSSGDTNLGYVRLDASIDFPNNYEISICVSPNFQNLGHGKEMLTKSISMHFEKYPLSKIIARVNNSNSASLSLFIRAGFTKNILLDDFILLELVNKNLRFVFRADASNEIGTGHTQRSLGLIEELIDLRYEVFFVGDTSEIPWVTNHLKFLGFSKILDNEQEFTSSSKTDVLILDSYTIPVNSEFINKFNWLLVVVIQDLYSPEYDAHLTVHPGVAENLYIKSNLRVLSGPEYVPLRKSIFRSSKRLQSSELIITVIGGGVDLIGFAEEMSKQLKVLPGSFTVNFFTNNAVGIEIDSRFKIFEFGSHLDEIGNVSELVFCTASTTALEFIARGCAVGICCGSSNQEQYYEALPKLGVSKPIGVFRGRKWIFDSMVIKDLVSSKPLRDQLSIKSIQLIDFDGAKRIIKEIMSF